MQVHAKVVVAAAAAAAIVARRAVCGLVVLPLLATFASAQPANAPPPPPGTLALNNLPAGAREAFFAGMDARHAFLGMTAVEHFTRALQIDSTFGLARVMRLEMTSGTAPFVAAEGRRAIADMATRPIPEATLALALRGTGVNTLRLLTAARAMYPNDRRIALEHAAAYGGEERLDSLRALVRRYPDWVAPRIYLAYQLSVGAYTSSAPEKYESLVVAEDAVRLDPRSATAHAILGQALHRLGRADDAVPHLQAATKLDARMEYAYDLQSEIFARDGKPRGVDRSRAAYDSAIAVDPNVARLTNQKREKAFLLFYDGRRAEALKELEAVAKEYEAAGAPGTAAVVYAQMAGLQAGCADSTGVDKLITEAHRVAPNANITVQAVQAYGLAKLGTQARRELTDYMRRADTTTVAYRADIRRLTGMTLLAEGKPSEALAEFKASENASNHFNELGMMDAYIALGNRAEAAAILARLAADRVYPNSAISGAIANCRARARMPRAAP